MGDTPSSIKEMGLLDSVVHPHIKHRKSGGQFGAGTTALRSSWCVF